MAPRMKAPSRLAGLVGSDSELDFDDISTMNTVSAIRDQVRQDQQTKRPRGRPPTNKISKLAAKTARRTSGDTPSAAKGSGRQALTEKSNVISLRTTSSLKQSSQTVSEGGNSDSGAGMAIVSTKTGRGRPKASKENKTATASRINREVAPAKPMKRSVSMAVSTSAKETPKTNDSQSMDVDSEEEIEEGALETEGLPSPDMEMNVYDGAAEQFTDDVPLRRRLGELTKKYEGLEVRHRDLREVGLKAGERNFERLKKQADENIAASTRLISQLKDEVVVQSKAIKQADSLSRDLEESEARVAELSNNLSDARREIKTLTAKLAASRTAESNLKVPGSALKAGSLSSRVTQSEAAHYAQAKEDLYGDLTGLIVRQFTQGTEEDVFDCIQTGRNGTLHFKLALEKGDVSDRYEDAQFTYRPQLDAGRDDDLMNLLPDFLVEEITFPRSHASKFYTRVTKSLTERPDYEVVD